MRSISVGSKKYMFPFLMYPIFIHPETGRSLISPFLRNYLMQNKLTYSILLTAH